MRKTIELFRENFKPDANDIAGAITCIAIIGLVWLILELI